MQELLEIKEKLLELKRLDKNFRVFGSQSHRYELFPTLQEREVGAFERKYQIRLPADYRLFLTQVGNGGAGPFYGVLPLNEAIRDSSPQLPFKWSSQIEVNFDNDPDFDRWRDERRGVIDICDEGCGSRTFLVVHGTSFGKIGSDRFDYIKVHEARFIDYYNNYWLDRNIKTLRNEPLIERIKTGMTKEAVIEIFGGAYDEVPAPDILKREFNDEATKLLIPYVAGNFLIINSRVVRIYRHETLI